MKVKEESEKVGLKLNIQITKIMASGPITSWKIDGETVSDFIFLGSKITANGVCSHEIKTLTPSKESYEQPAAAAKSLQSCSTLCDPIDGSPPGSSVPGILQARTLEWLPFPPPGHAYMFSCFSRVRLWVTLWTAAHQAPLSTGFSRQEYWSGLPFPSPIENVNAI